MRNEFLQLMIGTDKVPEKCIVCAGTTKEEWIEDILKIFDSHKKIACRGLGCSYLVKFKNKPILLMFNVWGGIVSLEATNLLILGGAKSLMFVGWTGAFEKEDIGGFIVPTKVHCFDGITKIIRPKMKSVYPNKEMLKRVKTYLDNNRIRYSTGATICTPSADLRIFRHFKATIKRLKPISVEMELSPFLFAAKDKKIPAAAILVVSDTSKKSELSKTTEKMRVKRQKDAIRCAAEIIEKM